MGRLRGTGHSWNLSALKFTIVLVFLVFCVFTGQTAQAGTSAPLTVTPPAKPAFKTKEKSTGLKKIQAAPKVKSGAQKIKPKKNPA